MKSLHLRNIAGQVNLRGKRSKMLRCGCCEVQDFRDAEITRVMRREMQDAAWEEMSRRYQQAHPWLAADFNEEEYEMSIINWYLNGGSPAPTGPKHAD